jgi:hypothetical protein
MSSVEFGCPVKNLAESHRPELGVHINLFAGGDAPLRRGNSRVVAPAENTGSVQNYRARKQLRERLQGS